VNVLCSFLNSITACASVSRSAILYDLHPHSQVSGLITAAVLLPVLLFLTSFFTHLPMCVLATIIMVALKGEHIELLPMLPYLSSIHSMQTIARTVAHWQDRHVHLVGYFCEHGYNECLRRTHCSNHFECTFSTGCF
jgi:hypothetical protein